MVCVFSWRPDAPLALIAAYNHNDFFSKAFALPTLWTDGCQTDITKQEGPKKRQQWNPLVCSRDLSARGAWFACTPDGRWACCIPSISPATLSALSGGTSESDEEAGIMMPEMWKQGELDARRGFPNSVYVPRSIYVETADQTAVRLRAAQTAQGTLLALTEFLEGRSPKKGAFSESDTLSPGSPMSSATPFFGTSRLCPTTPLSPPDDSPTAEMDTSGERFWKRSKWDRVRQKFAGAVERAEKHKARVDMLLFDPPALFEDIGEDTDGLLREELAGLSEAVPLSEATPSASVAASPKPDRMLREGSRKRHPRTS
eukprot:Hpha_TRINITY_DN2008_c0_g1::TRINITY_DN2008_c0_g1_i1::g.83022::m.83022